MPSPDLCKNSLEKSVRLNQRFTEIDDELTACMMRWEEIEARITE